MPDVTVLDNLTLPRITAANPAAPARRVKSITDAPSGFEGGGFPVRRAFAGATAADLDPFIHMDQMGEVEYTPGEPKGTPWHPHRGFETVRYMIDGTFLHRDSIGGGGTITNGSTQWMTAGSGILHIERPPEQLIATGGLFHGIQLWVNLPRAEKWVDPRYQDLAAEDTVLLTSPDGGALVRVIAGEVDGHRGPGSSYTPVSLVHATVQPGARLVLPWSNRFNTLIYVLSGAGTVGPESQPFHSGQLVVHGDGDTVEVAADQVQESRHPALELLILGGQPIREPVAAHGPFVMNTRDELVQAFDDYQAGRLGTVPALHVGNTRSGLRWTPDDIGDQTGRVALVTGANSGIGLETARELAAHGAHVVLACRDPAKARHAADELEHDLDQSSIELLTLDLSDLVAVRRGAEQFLAEHARLDLLINNAGVMGTPYRQTADGFELQMATNHLGHFALTGLLLDRLVMSGRSRVVTLSSLMHRSGHIDFDDVAGLKIRNTWAHYGSSKLANLLFTAELSRRLQAADEPVLAVGAHPGWTRSNLLGAGAALGTGKVRARASHTFGTHFGQSAAIGAWPSLYAATSPDVMSGQLIGPSHLAELFGPPTVVRPNRRARSLDDAARLWEISEQLTEVYYRFPAPL